MKFKIYVVIENKRSHTSNKDVSLISSGLTLTDFIVFPILKKKKKRLMRFAFISFFKDSKKWNKNVGHLVWLDSVFNYWYELIYSNHRKILICEKTNGKHIKLYSPLCLLFTFSSSSTNTNSWSLVSYSLMLLHFFQRNKLKERT